MSRPACNTLAGHTAPVAVTRHHVLLIPDRIQILSGIIQLGGFFHLDAAARQRAMACNGARNQVGFAVQLGTARFLGCFLTDPEDVPAVVVDYVAEQLGLDSSKLKGYGEKEARWDHQKLIREAYGSHNFEDHSFALACWVYRRAWSKNERPIVLFDLVTHRLVEAKILLLGVSTLERMISEVRERSPTASTRSSPPRQVQHRRSRWRTWSP